MLSGPKKIPNWDTPTLIPEVKLSISRLVMYNPKDCSSPGFSVHGILQARILEWVAIPFSRGLGLPPWGQILYQHLPTGEHQMIWHGIWTNFFRYVGFYFLNFCLWKVQIVFH